MKKLTIEHLASYYPYDIDIIISHRTQPNYKTKLTLPYLADPEGVKLILRPLSDLTKEIEHNGEKFIPIVELQKINPVLNVEGSHFVNFKTGHKRDTMSLPYWLIKKLFEWDFDIYELIDNGLAININNV